MTDVADRVNRLTAINPETGCIEWIGSVTRGGYAQIQVGGGRRVYVHRWAWERSNGRRVPEGLFLDHLCRNPKCCNPEHLEPVTFRENVLRGVSFAATNARKTECPRQHPYSPENTYVNPAGSRICRACKRERAAEYRRRKSVPLRQWIGGDAA